MLGRRPGKWTLQEERRAEWVGRLAHPLRELSMGWAALRYSFPAAHCSTAPPQSSEVSVQSWPAQEMLASNWKAARVAPPGPPQQPKPAAPALAPPNPPPTALPTASLVASQADPAVSAAAAAVLAAAAAMPASKPPSPAPSSLALTSAPPLSVVEVLSSWRSGAWARAGGICSAGRISAASGPRLLSGQAGSLAGWAGACGGAHVHMGRLCSSLVKPWARISGASWNPETLRKANRF